MASISQSKQRTKTSSTQKENATTTPVIEDWVRKGVQGWSDQVANFGKSDPSSFVAGPSQLQQQAFAGAQNLGGWQGGNQAAQNMVMRAAGAPASLASVGGYDPSLVVSSGYHAPTIADTAIGSATRANVPMLGQAAQATSQGYNPQTMSAAIAGSRGYNAQTMTAAEAASRGYSAQTMTAAEASARGYDPRLNGPAAQAGSQGYDAAQAAAIMANASRGSEFLNSYLNPYTRQVVDTTLADFDVDAGRRTAQQSAQAAQNRAFGGSRFALREAATEGELSRARAAAAASLRSNAFNTAAGLGMQDADRFTNVSLNNSQVGSQANLANAASTNSARQFGAAAANQASLANAGFQNQNAWNNQDAFNRAAEFGAAAGNQASLANAGFRQQAGMANMEAGNQASQFNTAAENQALLANAGYRQQAGLANMEAGNQAAQFGAAAANQADLTNAGFRQQAGAANMEAGNRAAEFGAGAANQAGLANMAAQNQFGLAQFGANADASQNFANAQNQFGLAGYQGQLQRNLAQAGMQENAARFGAEAANTASAQNAGFRNQASQFGAAAINQNNQFNASQQDQAIARQLQGAGMLGDLSNAAANNQRADLGLTADLGAQQQALEQMRVSAPLQYMQLMAQLQGSIPYGMFNGQNVVGETNANGTSITKSKPSVMAIWSDLAAKAAQAAAAASDRRLKRDIERVGEHEGLGLYRFNYHWDDDNEPPRTGVMADEVAVLRPDALGPLIGGEYQSVYYHKLGLGHLTAGMN